VRKEFQNVFPTDDVFTQYLLTLFGPGGMVPPVGFLLITFFFVDNFFLDVY